MKAFLKRTLIQSRFIHWFFFYWNTVTQFLGGLWKGTLCKEKGSWCPWVQNWIAWGFSSRGSFDRDALPTVLRLFLWMKRETSDTPLNVDDSPLCALELCMRMNGWGARGRVLNIKCSLVASLTTHGLTGGREGRARDAGAVRFPSSRQARWAGLSGGNSQPPHSSFISWTSLFMELLSKKK